MAKSIVFGTKIILQVSSINIYGWSSNANVGSNIINILKGKVNFWTPCTLFATNKCEITKFRILIDSGSHQKSCTKKLFKLLVKV